MSNAFDVLARDHEEVKRMLTELETGPTAAVGANSEQLALRKRMTEQLVIEESRHEAVEETYFWPVVREHLPDGDGLADQALSQEGGGSAVLDRLDELGPEDDRFEGVLAEFITAGRAHIAFEEAHVWPGLRAVLTAGDADDLGRRLEQGRKPSPSPISPSTRDGRLHTRGS